MSIVTLNTQCLTFAFKYFKTRTLDLTNTAPAYEFDFYTDGKGNILSSAEDAAWMYVDCEKRHVWCNLPGVDTPSYREVMGALQETHPLIHDYIATTRRGREDNAVALEKALQSLPVIPVSKKTVIRMEVENYRKRPSILVTGDQLRENSHWSWDSRTLLGWRAIGFTEDGSVAPVYCRQYPNKDKPVYYQDFDEMRYGFIALHYGYADDWDEPATDDKLAQSAYEMRKLLAPYDNLRIYSFRVRADGAVRLFPRHAASAKWFAKLDIPEEAIAIASNGLHHVLQPLGSKWDRGYTLVTFELPYLKHYMRYAHPTISGSLGIRNTTHTVYFALDEDGNMSLVALRDMKKGDVVYRLRSSMVQGHGNGPARDTAPHQIRHNYFAASHGSYRGYYSCEVFIANEHHQLTNGTRTGISSPIAEVRNEVISRLLKQMEETHPKLYSEVTFECYTG